MYSSMKVKYSKMIVDYLVYSFMKGMDVYDLIFFLSYLSSSMWRNIPYHPLSDCNYKVLKPDLLLNYCYYVDDANLLRLSKPPNQFSHSTSLVNYSFLFFVTTILV